MREKLIDKAGKKEKYVSEESVEVKRFVFILLGIIVLVLAFYGITKLIDKKDNSIDITVTEGEINYDITSIGTMLNKNDDEYYVMIYNQESTDAVLYSSIINKYTSGENSLNVYFCDLGNKLNEQYHVKEGSKTNTNASSIDELALGDLTLIRVKKGKIVKYIESLEAIKKELS